MRILKHSDWDSDNVRIYIPNDSIRFEDICEVSYEVTDNSLCLNFATKKEKYMLLSPLGDEEFLKKLGRDIAAAAKINFEAVEATVDEAFADVKAEAKKEEKPKAKPQAVFESEYRTTNPVAKRLREVSGHFSNWADSVFNWILGITAFECLVALIVSFVLVEDSIMYLWIIPAIVLWFALGCLLARIVRFILNCISIDYLGKSEVVQYTCDTAHALKKKKDE